MRHGYIGPWTTDVYPLQVLLVTLAGWVNRHQQHVIEYLVEENRVLKEQVKGRLSFAKSAADSRGDRPSRPKMVAGTFDAGQSVA
jgi:hypothetical protein